jgi:uracil-DNA glycosylase family 4
MRHLFQRKSDYKNRDGRAVSVKRKSHHGLLRCVRFAARHPPLQPGVALDESYCRRFYAAVNEKFASEKIFFSLALALKRFHFKSITAVLLSANSALNRMPPVNETDSVADRRMRHWLRAERAFGLTAVRTIDIRARIRALEESETPPRAEGVIASAPVLQEMSVAKRKPVAASSAIAGQSTLIAPPSAAPFTAPLLPRTEKTLRLEVMDRDEVKNCTRCRLHQTRTNTVFGEGDVDAQIFFVGEGPGENEDQTGRPFVGRAGQLLDKMIRGMGLSRPEVFIANIVKCRPPNNRVPATDEVATCTPYLERQLEIVRPRVIVTLGRPATTYMLNSKLPMGQLRGKWQSWRGIRLMPTFHPSYVLRSYTEEVRAAVWSDLKQVLVELGLPVPQRKNDAVGG